jgi:CHRD domain
MKKVFVFLTTFLGVGLMLNFSNSSSIYAQTKTMKSTHKTSTQLTFTAQLSGKNVVPPVKTDATGSAKFTFDKNMKSMHYVVHLEHADSVVMTHIHHAPKGKNGPIAVWLFKFDTKPITIKNGMLSQGDITNKDINLDSLRTWMKNGDTYVLVHTIKHPQGEIRGQIH